MTAFFKAFVYAWSGICEAFARQRNMRIHGLLSILAVLISIFLKMSAVEWAILSLTLALVMTTEMLNSAIESTLDFISLEIHPQIKLAKDMAAGSVLIASLFAIAVGVALWGNKITALLRQLNN